MQQYPLLKALAVVFLVSAPIFVYSASAESTSNSNVDATITCNFDTGAHLTVRAHMIVNSINVFDTTYNRQAIEDMATTNQYIMGAIMLRLHELVKTQIESAFTNAEVDTINTIPLYEKPYFIDDFQVNLTASFFHYNGSMNFTNFISGVLDMGATATYHLNLQAQPGWNTTYIYTLPPTMTLAYANSPDSNPDTNKVTWVLRNWDGNDAGKDATLSTQSKNPTTPTSEPEEISVEFDLDTRRIDEISFTNSIVLKKMNIDTYKILPDFITKLDILPADGIRLFIDSGLLSWEDLLEKTIQPIEQQITPIIENSSFQHTLNLSFTWDAESTINCSTPYNLTHMDDWPSIRADFRDPDVDLQICQMPARAFFGLMNAGATASISSADISFGLGLNGIIYPYEIMLHLPTNISLDEEDSIYIWNKTKPITGTFSSNLQPTTIYTDENIDSRIEIELSKMDLNVPSIFTGKTELTVSTKMKEDDRLFVIRRDGELSFSPKINITYLNSDALRLCIEENVFSESQVTSFLSQKTEMFQQRLSEILYGLNVKGIIDRKIFSNSLVWDGDISSMDNIIPVVVSNYANNVYAVGFNVSLWPIDLTIAAQRFSLQGIENQTVTYRIIFPRGITVNASDSAGKTIITGKTNDGRDYVELSFDAGLTPQSTVLTCVLNVSPVYVFSLFLPCILVFILLVVLVVIIYLIRKKRGGLRRGKGKLFEPEDNEPSDYSGQDYYVPPPPSSKKKRK
jgi:hypothetical protein